MSWGMQENGEDKRKVWANYVFINQRKKSINRTELQNKHKCADAKACVKSPGDRVRWLGQSWGHEPQVWVSVPILCVLWCSGFSKRTEFEDEMFLITISLIMEERARNGVGALKVTLGFVHHDHSENSLPPWEVFSSIWNLPLEHILGWFCFHSSYGNSYNCTQTGWFHSRWEVGFHDRPEVVTDWTETPGDTALQEDRVSCVYSERGWFWEGGEGLGGGLISQSAAALQSIVAIISSIDGDYPTEVEVVQTNLCHMDKLFFISRRRQGRSEEALVVRFRQLHKGTDRRMFPQKFSHD